MKKKIILFKGGVETLGFFSIQLANAFEEMGYQTFIFDMEDQFNSFNKLINFCHKGEATIITFNFIGLSGETIFYSENHLFFDDYKIRCLNIVVDHPFYYYKNYCRLPKNYMQFCIDKKHLQYMKRFYGNIELGPFLPLAGTSYADINADINANIDITFNKFIDYDNFLSKRNIDIIFTGNYTPPSNFEPQINRLGDDYSVFYKNIIDDLIAHPYLDIAEAFEQHLVAEIEDISDSDLNTCMANMIFIDLYIRFYMRGKVVKTLVDNGFKVDVFGNGLDMQTYRHPENLIMHGGVNSLTCLRKLATSKISLNVMPWFKDGAHDRIFNAAMNGAVNLSDSSKYLHEIFDNKNAIAFYDLSKIDDLPEITHILLSNPDKMISMSQNAYNITSNFHTWRQRAKILEKYL